MWDMSSVLALYRHLLKLSWHLSYSDDVLHLPVLRYGEVPTQANRD
jgi:hypothetical protein